MLSQNLHKKWIVYNSFNPSINGWSSIIDNYIIDFSDKECLIIKSLGENDTENIYYEIDFDNRKILEKDKGVLYYINELSENKLILKMGYDNETLLYLLPINETNKYSSLSEISTIITSNFWYKDLHEIQFLNDIYYVADEIKTNYKLFYENENSGVKTKGAWLLDIYQDILFLELFSLNSNHKSIYIITEISTEKLLAVGIDKNGNFLPFEIENRK